MAGRLHFQPVGGFAGDMLVAALLDLGAPRDNLDNALASVSVDCLQLRVERCERAGESALYVQSIAKGRRMRTLREVTDCIRQMPIRAEAENLALRVFQTLAEAEAQAHNATIDTVHLHEVGDLDSILDVVGFAVLFHELGAPQVTSETPPRGGGQVHTEHGWLDCPVPAVRAIAERYHIPMQTGPIQSETITPTGIAIVASVPSSFASVSPPAEAKCGVGAGTRNDLVHPNVVRAFYWP